jgi:hypothetical protein
MKRKIRNLNKHIKRGINKMAREPKASPCNTVPSPKLQENDLTLKPPPKKNTTMAGEPPAKIKRLTSAESNMENAIKEFVDAARDVGYEYARIIEEIQGAMDKGLDLK